MHIASTLFLALLTVARPAPSAELRGEELMKALQGGGYTVMLRHARTDRTFQEVRDPMPIERIDQRNLNDAGVRDARLMGVVFRKYGISFAEIVTSPMYRTRETAEYAAGKPTSITMALRVFPSTAEQAALVAAPVKAGTNRLIVTHHFVIEKHVPGITPGAIDESEAAVIRTAKDGSVELVGRIQLADWAQLAGNASTSATTSPTGVTPAASTAEPEPLPAGFVSPPIPQTAAGRLARGYLEAIASGNEATMRAYIESSLLPNPDRPTAVRLEGFASTAKDFGPMVVTGIQSSKPDELILNVRTKRGNFVLTTRVSPTDASRAASITISGTQGGHG